MIKEIDITIDIRRYLVIFSILIFSITLLTSVTNAAPTLFDGDTTIKGELEVQNSSGDTSWVVIQKEDGNVGIGSTDPSQKLDVAGNGTFTGTVTAGNKAVIVSDGVDAYFLHSNFIDNLTTQYALRHDPNGSLYINSTGAFMAFKINNDYKIYMKSDGNVGIGTDDPQYILDVHGTFNSSGSSIMYKENINNLEIDTNLIYQLRPVSYDYKSEYKQFGFEKISGREIGLIAEEVAETIPELAIMREDSIDNVDYQKLTVLLLAELKKLKADIELLKQHIQALQNQ